MPFGHRHPLVGHPVPPVGFRPSHDRPTEPRSRVRTPTGFPRSAHARCDRGGRPLYPEASGVHATDVGSPVAACRLCQRPGPTTRIFPSVVPGSRSRGIIRGSLAFARPVFPSPGCSPDGTGALGLLPRASHPQQAGPVGRTSRWGLISNTDQELRLRHRRPPLHEFTRNTRLRVALTRHRYAAR